MNRLMLVGTAEPVSRGQIIRHERGQGNVHFPCSSDNEQDSQPCLVASYSAICDGHAYLHIMPGEVLLSQSFIYREFICIIAFYRVMLC